MYRHHFRDAAQVLAILVILLGMLIWAEGTSAQPKIKYCKNLRTGEIVVVEGNYPCPAGTVKI